MGWIIWLAIAAVLIIAEMATLTFYLLWLGVGALAAAGMAFLLPDALLLQVLIGCAVALILTLFTNPLTKRLHASRGFKDAIDDLVGKQGVVVEEINADKMGIVKVGNETWSATSGSELVKGEHVIIVHRGSAVLEVEKWGRV